jgi:hypothetical protein
MLWEIAPATDKLNTGIQSQLAGFISEAMLQAEQKLQPAQFNIGVFQLLNVTRNRRASISPYVKPWTIDPQLGLFRVDTTAGAPLATLWNFAIHGVCYGPSNMYASADIMGKVNQHLEQNVGGVALFVNADAGDIDPGSGMCDGAPDFKGAGIIADKIAAWRATIKPQTQMKIQAASQIVHFGDTNMNLTLQRLANCTTGGPFDICAICMVLKCDINLHLNNDWVENAPRFAGFHIAVDNKHYGIASIPGEALYELGTWIKADGAALKYDQTLLFGYSNNHMGYFCTPDEYDIGGYESQLTFWGYDTASRVRNAAKAAMQAVRG